MYREFRLQNTEEGVQVAMELTIYYKTCVQTTKQLKYSVPSGRIERCIKYYGNLVKLEKLCLKLDFDI